MENHHHFRGSCIDTDSRKEIILTEDNLELKFSTLCGGSNPLPWVQMSEYLSSVDRVVWLHLGGVVL